MPPTLSRKEAWGPGMASDRAEGALLPAWQLSSGREAGGVRTCHAGSGALLLSNGYSGTQVADPQAGPGCQARLRRWRPTTG